MDFSTAHAAPVPITIDGTTYSLPRFLLPQFKAWVANRQKKQVDQALEQLGEDLDARARFLLYFQPVPQDVTTLLEEATTPEGVEYVVNASLEAAGVPQEKRTALLTYGDPLKIRTLAESLLSGSHAKSAGRAASDDKGPRSDPQSGQSPTSGGSPTTTATTSGASTKPPPAQTPTV